MSRCNGINGGGSGGEATATARGRQWRSAVEGCDRRGGFVSVIGVGEGSRNVEREMDRRR